MPSRPPHQTWPVSFGLAGSLMSYWRMSPCSQLEKYRQRSSIETTRSVIRPGTGNGQPSTSSTGTSMTFSTSQLAVLLVPVPHVGAEGGADEAVRAVRVVVEADLQRDQAVLPEVDALGDLALLPVPEVQLPAVLALGHVLELEAGLEGVGGGPLAGDHHVVPRLVPEVVVELHAVGAALPAAGDVELLVQQQEPAGAVALAVAEHRDHDPVRQAVDGVRRGQVGLLDDLFGLDHLVQLRRALLGCVDDVDAARALARHDQVAARFVLVAVARAAGVPAEVVQFVADVGHRGRWTTCE